MSYRAIAVALAIGFAALTPGAAAELDPAAVIYKMPKDLQWKDNGGSANVVLFGDPSKPGLYGVLNKWKAGNHFSHPHSHPNDRFITVISGTWWVGSGTKWDPENSSVPMHAGTFVTHFGKHVHWDGAKDEDAVILIVGEGPATSTPAAETK